MRETYEVCESDNIVALSTIQSPVPTTTLRAYHAISLGFDDVIILYM